MVRKRLREGFTTGSAAAAAAKAALLHLTGQRDLKSVEIPLPIGRRMTVPIDRIEELKDGVRATVVKDGGDDPDATHKARIRSTVEWSPAGANGHVAVRGGKGVGKVTRPGLPVAVGEAAINPVPRKQIAESVLEVLEVSGLKGAISVTIDVVNGAEIAKKTLNSRLGILGGISILGSRGTVKPFSNSSYRDTITLSMDVAKAGGAETIALSTGGKSEGFLKKLNPELPDFSYIQVGDFFSFSLREAVKRGFTDILYACFFGKLVKMALGFPYTHARKCVIDFQLLAHWCLAAGMEEDKTKRITQVNTAREALSMIQEDGFKDAILSDILGKALAAARGFAGPGPNLRYFLFDFEGTLLNAQEDEGKQA
jgi:cobalt-precorrin-5B (C1)-methyltransferase